MKKIIFCVISILFLVLIAIPCSAWEGRMGGMSYPFGLVADESDFLIHPALMANGKGTHCYSGYRFTYDRATDWNFDTTMIGQPPGLDFEGDGHGYGHDGQAGMAFQVGKGRMGLFAEYGRKDGSYSGKQINNADPGIRYDLDSTYDNYAIRLIYGQSHGSANLGGELRLAYIDEQNENTFSEEEPPRATAYNYPWAARGDTHADLFTYQIPYDSNYWEVSGKASFEGPAGAARYAVTLGGGAIFSSDNEYKHYWTDDDSANINLSGDVTGWNIKGDFWYRRPIKPNLSMPLMIKASYKFIERDGEGPCPGCESFVWYVHEARTANVEAGGGLDYEPCEGARLSGGLYYDYFWSRDRVKFYGASSFWQDSELARYGDYPIETEHRVTFRGAAERRVRPDLTLRAGVSLFYGWIPTHKYHSTYTYNSVDFGNDFVPYYRSGDGHRWGVSASTGATFRFTNFDVEPYISAGYQSTEISGEGYWGDHATFTDVATDYDHERNDWILAAGITIRF
jgi:hypothetical protein